MEGELLEGFAEQLGGFLLCGCLQRSARSGADLLIEVFGRVLNVVGGIAAQRPAEHQIGNALLLQSADMLFHKRIYRHGGNRGTFPCGIDLHLGSDLQSALFGSIPLIDCLFSGSKDAHGVVPHITVHTTNGERNKGFAVAHEQYIVRQVLDNIQIVFTPTPTPSDDLDIGIDFVGTLFDAGHHITDDFANTALAAAGAGTGFGSGVRIAVGGIFRAGDGKDAA